MQKTLNQDRLEVIRQLLGLNTYLLSSNTHPNLQNQTPVLDSLLVNGIWNNSLGQLFASQGVDSLNAFVSAWRKPYQVKKKVFAAGDPFVLGPQKGEGSLINPNVPTYFVVVAGDNLDASDIGEEITFANGVPDDYEPQSLNIYGQERYQFIDDPAFRTTGTGFIRDLFPEEQVNRRAFLLNTLDTEESRNNEEDNLIFPAFDQDVDAYICFPTQDVIDEPFWFHNNTQAIGVIEVTDQELRIGGEQSGFSIHLESGGHRSYFQFPGWLEPFLGGIDPASNIDDPNRNRKLHFTIDAAPTETIDATGIPFIDEFLANITGGTAIRQLKDINLDLQMDIGSLAIDLVNENAELPFADNAGPFPGIKMKLAFETGGPEEVEAVDGLDTDLTKIELNLTFLAVLREKRLYWHLVPSATVESNGGPIDNEVTGAIEKALDAQVSEILDPSLANFLMSLLLSLPANHEASPISNQTSLLLLDDILGGVISEFTGVDNGVIGMRSPDFQTSLIPSNITALLPRKGGALDFDFNTNRIMDRFVKYNTFDFQAGDGQNRISMTYDLMDAHDGRLIPLDHVVVPIEQYALRPTEVRLMGSKGSGPWLNFLNRELDKTLNYLRKSRLEWIVKDFYPKLRMEYTVSVVHDAIEPDLESRVFTKQFDHILARIDRPNDFGPAHQSEIFYFDDGRLFPPSFVDHIQALEIEARKTLDDNADNDEFLPGKLIITGKASLETWRLKGGTGCLGALIQLGANIAAGIARNNQQNDADLVAEAEDLNSAVRAEARIRAELEDFVVDLGEFKVERSLTEISGLSPAEPAESNTITASNDFMEIDFNLNRESVDGSVYDWLIAHFISFKIDLQKFTSKDLVENDRLEIRAFINDQLLADAEYYIGNGPTQGGQRINARTVVELEGLRWRKSNYFRKDDLGARVKLRFEVIKAGAGVVAVAQKEVDRRQYVAGRASMGYSFG